MPEKPSPWAVVQEIDEKTADRRIEDNAVDVYQTSGQVPGQRFFRVFNYGNSRPGLEMIRDVVQESARFTVLSDPEIVGPMNDHFDQRFQGQKEAA